jgi:hypothetical protein
MSGCRFTLQDLAHWNTNEMWYRFPPFGLAKVQLAARRPGDRGTQES